MEKTPDDPLYVYDYALVDSPSDHPDLAPNVYKSADKPNNGKDDDKNGWVDDTYACP